MSEIHYLSPPAVPCQPCRLGTSIRRRLAALVDELIIAAASAVTRIFERIPAEVIRFIVIAMILPSVMAGGDKGDPTVPIFDGVTATYTAWFIAFLGWMCWKRPSLTPLLDGSLVRPGSCPRRDPC